MLVANDLRDRLRVFCDEPYASFAGFPTTRDIARDKWATAFAAYFNTVEEDLLPAVPGHPSMLHGGVKTAFFNSLGLDLTMSAAAAATDFADAWKAGVTAATPGAPPGATDGTFTYIFAAMQPAALTTKYTSLQSTLQSLFESPSASGVTRIGEIADAFHAATTGLKLTGTKTNISTGVTAPFTIGVK